MVLVGATNQSINQKRPMALVGAGWRLTPRSCGNQQSINHQGSGDGWRLTPRSCGSWRYPREPKRSKYFWVKRGKAETGISTCDRRDGDMQRGRG